MNMDDTTDPSYWLNWRFFTCAAYVLIVIVGASVIIWKYEGPGDSSPKSRRKKGEDERRVGYLHRDEAWETSVAWIHPAWLLVYRLCAFIVLLAILISELRELGVGSFYFYTQWTFALVTVYFGVGTAISIHGCRLFRARLVPGKINRQSDVNRSAYEAVRQDADEDENRSSTKKGADTHSASSDQPTTGFLSYSFQVIFQVAAGAAMLSDSVFWFLIYPFLLPSSFHLNLVVFSMHFFNVAFLIGDAFLNRLRFPFFRLAYLALWTIIYVLFQWGAHACYSMWWPYPFLDLSSPYAPAWYLAIGLIQLPCFGLFALIVKLKHFLLSKFPQYV
uniref:Uncharacterized protein n=1 Tax=Kalanchoe fedtschenkoi TaxID=63787 RepID=A0A7N0VGC5_KALFE